MLLLLFVATAAPLGTTTQTGGLPMLWPIMQPKPAQLPPAPMWFQKLFHHHSSGTNERLLVAKVSCNHAWPTIASSCAHHGARTGYGTPHLGAIGPGVHLLTTAVDPEVVTVRFPDGAASAITPLKGARLLVRRADVAGCPGFSAP